MTLDERLEALVQSVELLAAMHRDSETKSEERFAKMVDAINRLAHIAEIHDRRISGLEGQN